MSMNLLRSVSYRCSCPEFDLKMGPKPIFVGKADTAKFPNMRYAKYDGMSMKYVQAVSAVSSCPEFARTAAKFPSGEVAA